MVRYRQMYIFSQVVEQGSISRAAESLSLSKSVVSQHLKGLERELGITLLKRTTRKQHLTSQGQAFFHHCQQMNQLCEHAWEEARSGLETPSGSLKITASHAVMDSLVAPVAGILLGQYSQLDIELITNDRQLNMMSEDLDLAIRVGPSTDSSAKQRRIGQFRDVLCATSDVINQGVKGLPYIANQWEIKGQSKTIQHLMYHGRTAVSQQLDFSLRCVVDSFHTCLNLIRQGAGVGLVPEFVFAQCPELLPVLPDYQVKPVDLYALHPFQHSTPVAVSTCLSLIEQKLKDGVGPVSVTI